MYMYMYTHMLQGLQYFGLCVSVWVGGVHFFVMCVVCLILSLCPPSNPPVCNCGQPAFLLTVRKPGPNTGILYIHMYMYV